MATEDVRISARDSEARVALDLMVFIAAREQIDETSKRSRDHWLKLYYQCRLAAREAALSSILKPL
jgi:hypothetical protein